MLRWWYVLVGCEGDGAQRDCYVHKLWTDLWNIGCGAREGSER